MKEKDWEYEYWFACVRRMCAKTKKRIRDNVPSAKDIYYMEETELKRWTEKEEEAKELLESKKSWNLEKEYERLLKEGISFLPYFHSEYPKSLECLHSAPYAVYRKGYGISEHTVKAAIVGARQCSPYGERMAMEFGEVLAAKGIDIISGMARGVDGAGHRGALNVGGRSFGILASGVDICYPKEHIGLYVDLQERGGLYSEFPPGTRPLPQFFPARNRLISACADIILVMEAKEKSGSLITADQALELGKDVYALPGPVNSALSVGCNRLIRQGAGILLSPEELLEELCISGSEDMKKKLKNKIKLESRENMVYSCLGLYPKNVNQLMEETKMQISDLMNQLISLQVKGYVEEISKNYYVRKAGFGGV